MSGDSRTTALSIAITGIGGIFPGAENLEEFWKMIAEARSASEVVPDGRWPEKAESYHDTKVGAPDKVLSPNNCSIKHIPQNYDGINLPLDFIKTLDPLYQIALQAGRDAFKDCVTQGLDLSKVPVIMANIVLPTDSTSNISRNFYMQILKAESENRKPSIEELFKDNPYNRYSAELPAGLLAAGLGLGGGCYTLDAACASSLYAIKLACEELISGRADAVLTGGASRPSSQFTQMGFSQLRALSKSGVCRPFDKRADGLLVGEGAGMFMLKRLDDAIASNDKIYGIIRGIGLSNDVGGSLLAPDKEGQVRAMRAAYAQAHWSPADIQLIECHGTGTPKGDAVEVSSIKEILQGTDSKECVIGSVKSNVGHLLTGAGAAGLMKLVFALKNKQLPPTAGYEIPDEKLELEKSPIKILQKPKVWNPAKDGEPRRCALSAFGFGGINAHVLIEEYIKDKSLNTENFKAEKLPEVAIVSMNTMVGDLKNLKEFQEAVLNCTPDKKPISEKRKQAVVDIPWLQEGAFIEEVDVTPGEFKISPIEIPEVLPQQLLMLKTVSGALKSLVGKEHSRLNWGTYIGISQDFEASNFASRWAIKEDSKAFGLNNYDEKQLCDSITPPLNNARTVGALGGIVASRIAREYSIGGPSHTFSSAENSGLSALEAAVRALQRNEIDTAIVGAVDFAGDLRNMLANDKLRPYSRKSSSTPFEKGTDGAFPGEGAGAVILKRKEDAIKDGDVIFSIIKGFGKGSSNHFEDKDSLKSAYEKAISQAWKESGFKPENIGLLETSGSGFPIEDKIEAEAIADFMPVRPDNKEDTFKNNDQLCALSSTKMVIGHTGAASGLLSLIKAAICLHQQILPAFKTLKNPIEALNKRKDSFFTPNQPQFWLRNRINGPRTAGVSSIGVDGSVYHTVLEGFEDDSKLSIDTQKVATASRILPTGELTDAIFIVGGTSPCDLRERVSALVNLESDSIQSLAREYWKECPVKPNAKYFCSIVASSFPELRKRAEYAVRHLYTKENKPILNGPEVNDRIFYSPDPMSEKGKICFAFPGSGNHFLGMGFELGATFPEFQRDLDSQYDLLAAQFGARRIAPWRLSYEDGWEDKAMQDLIDDHNSLVFSHVSCCSLVSDIVRSFGIKPDIIMGYSLGETAGNYATRTWTSRDEMIRRMRDSNLFTTELIGRYNSARKYWGLDDNAEIDWLLGMVTCSASEVEKYLPEYKQVYILIINTPDECVIGGNRPQVEDLVKKLNKPFFSLSGVSSVHCPAAIPAEKAYYNLHYYENTCPPDGVKFISSAKGIVFKPTPHDSADSIRQHCIDKIDFPKDVELAYKEGARLFLELGPKSSMTRMINAILGDRPHFARSAMSANQPQMTSMLKFIANCAAEGIRIDLSNLYGREVLQIKSDIKSKLKPVAVYTGHVPTLAGVERKDPLSQPSAASSATRSHPVARLHADLPVGSPSSSSNSGGASIRTAPLTTGEVSASADERGLQNNTIAESQRPLQSLRDSSPSSSSNSGGASIRTAPTKVGEVSRSDERGLTSKPKSIEDVKKEFYNTHKSTRNTPKTIASIFQQKLGKKMDNKLVSEWLNAQNATAQAHEEFLRLNNAFSQAQIALLTQQLMLSQNLTPEQLQQLQQNQTVTINYHNAQQSNLANKPVPSQKMPKSYNGPVFLDWKGSMEFAVGKIGKALGDFFAPIDNHPTRVRLPDIPLNFVDRIITVEGEKGSLGKGRVVTEHDVYPNAWYLDNDCMPTGLAVEAGQADLFLSGWLGIDFKTKGIAKYRLLDATISYHGPLPRPGDTLHYDIRVDRFIRQADTYLFFFEYDGSINGRHLITMRNGCAGFFTDKQLAEGKGIVLTEDDIKPEPKPDLPGRENLPQMVRESYDDNKLALLRQGNIEAAFGPQFAGISIYPHTIPDGKMKMIDRITEIDPHGGRFGLGRIKAEIDIPQEAWFLTQHFCDDQVMPGTLMYESCMQSLRVFLLRMGWIAPAQTSSFEPVLGVKSQLRCRGQVIKGVKKALYDIEIKELGYNPEPYAIADALMFADGKRIVQVMNMSIRLTNTNRQAIEALWLSKNDSSYNSNSYKQNFYQEDNSQLLLHPSVRHSSDTSPQVEALGNSNLNNNTPLVDPETLPAIYTAQQIYEYAIGKPSLCFGDAFKEYDNGKFLARLPNPPFLFVDRITKVDAEFLKIKTGGTVQGQFDIKPDHWFFKCNKQTSIPFAVMLEFPLQVCGWYSCFMGSANTSKEPLHYRNLDGSAILYEDVNMNSGTLTATVKSTKAANAGGMLIQSFDLLVTKGDRKIYEGNTTFGFFSEAALANQIGLVGAKPYQPTSDEMARSIDFPLTFTEPIDPTDLNHNVPMNGLNLPGKCFLMLDKITAFIPDGGPNGLGFIRGINQVDPSRWFFKAHFYQDPVIPGSLGLESFMQLLKCFAIHRWGKQLANTPCHYQAMAVGQKHTWSYRGQVIPKDKLVTVDACITKIDDATHTITADGFLVVDGRIIYSMKDFALRVALD